jgi:glutamate dehydrogenase/leucine dehydrogenase
MQTSAVKTSRSDQAPVATMGPRIDRLSTVDGMVVYDVPAAPFSGGGTRLAPDIDESEMVLLARAMTYKLAVLRLKVGGAKIGLRATAADRASVIDRFRREIAPRLESGTLMTGPDLGTSEDDFAGLPTPGGSAGLAASDVQGIPVEEMLTGSGVVSALAAALGGDLNGRRVALEGFGKMGTSIARELGARGGRITAVSTVYGCAMAEPGKSFSPRTLIGARRVWGDSLVCRLGVGVRPKSALWSADCDAVVPGARPGVIDAVNAGRIRAPVVVPVANAPYTETGLETLRERGIDAHADFICSAGGAMAYLVPSVAGAPDIDVASGALDEIMGAMVRQTLEHPRGPYAGAVARAEGFMHGWLPEGDRAAGPPIVPA